MMPQPLPTLSGALGRAGIHVQGLGVLVPHAQGRLSHVDGDLRVGTALHVDIPLVGNAAQLLRVLDLVALGLALGGQQQCMADVAAVIRVGGRAGGDLAGEVA